MKKCTIITGATSGIGYAVLKMMLDKGMTVIGVGRNRDKLNEMEKDFSFEINEKRLILVQGDLSDNESVRKLSTHLMKVIETQGGILDILMNVAGLVKTGYEENKDGNELTFATNHLSVYLLTGLLFPYLIKSKDPRVLVVSSLSHYRACFDKTNIQSKRFYNVLRGYQRSKLYNVLFIKYFSRFEKNIKIYAIDPGLVKTEIGGKHTKGLANIIWKIHIKDGVDAKIPAENMTRIALDPSYKSLSGLYFKDGREKKSSRITYHAKKQNILWDVSKKLTNFTYPFDS